MMKKRIKRVASSMATALVSALEDGKSADREDLAGVRARLAASSHKKAETLGGHYVADVQLLLDEVDRLRYEVDRT